jgi:hypothetical protein
VEDRIRLISSEEESYLAAQEPKQLQAYVEDCKVCNFRDEANAQLGNLNRQQLYGKLNAVGTSEEALKKFLTECSDSCPQDVREEAQARLGTTANSHSAAAPTGN